MANLIDITNDGPAPTIPTGEGSDQDWAMGGGETPEAAPMAGETPEAVGMLTLQDYLTSHLESSAFEFAPGFTFFDTNPLPNEIPNISGFARKTIISEDFNTGIHGSASPVQDPLRKASRNIWVPNEELTAIQFADDRLALYNEQVPFEDNLNNIDFNEEGYGGLTIVYDETDSEQGKLYFHLKADSQGLPIYKNKFILNFKEMYHPSLTSNETIYGARAKNIAGANAIFEAMFYPNNLTEVDGLFGYEVAYTTATQTFIDATGPETMFVPLVKIGNFNVQAPVTFAALTEYKEDAGDEKASDPQASDVNLPTYQFTDHTIEMGRPFPIINFDVSNFSISSLVADYDVFYNPEYASDVTKAEQYESLAAQAPETHGLCPYTVVSQERNKVKGFQNGAYSKLLSLNFRIGDDVMEADLTRKETFRKYLSHYTSIYSILDTDPNSGNIIPDFNMNRNIILRDKEILKETRKMISVVPYAINLRFLNTQEADYANVLKSFGMDVVLMSLVAQDYVTGEGTPPSYIISPDEASYAVMTQDKVLQLDDDSTTEPIEMQTSNFFDAKVEGLKTWNFVDVLDTIGYGDSQDLTGILNNTNVSNEVLVQNEESHFKPSNNFFLKDFAAAVCKTEVIQRAATKTRSVLDIYQGKKADYEILFFRVEKTAIAEGGTGGVFKQNFFIFNDGQNLNEYLDMQVKYGKKYTYKVYAYTLIYGTQYQPFIDDPDYNRTGPVYIPDLDFVDGVFMETEFTGEILLPLSVLYKPSIKLVEVPYATYQDLSVLDKPPLPPEVEFFPYKFDPTKLFISLVNSNGYVKEAPIALNPSEEQKFDELRKAQKTDKEEIVFRSDDEPKEYEIWRTGTEPADYSDFYLLTSVDVSDNKKSFIDSLSPNADYWYFFRSKDVHGNISNPSFVYKVRLISDNVTYVSVTQHKFEQEEEASSAETFSKFLNISIYEEDQGAVGKTIKMRLRSLRTDKKMDFNIDFSSKQITNPETGTN